MNKKLTTEEFINRARKIHGNEYDYSKVEYVNNRTKLIIICPKHGDFEQTPNTHLKGSGCPKCYGTHKKTTDEFIRQSKDIHGDKFTYEHTEYKTKHQKVCITCQKHGDFWILPNNHLKGGNYGGCPKCAFEKRTKTTETFIVEANKVHHGKYEYFKVNYETNHKKVCIICPKHGDFWQTPSQHLRGNGCPKCKIDNVRKALSSTKEKFVEKANKVHNNKYDYYLVNYINSSTNISIICPTHGIFKQRPIQHLHGQGCPYCAGKVLKTTEQFIKDARVVHGDKYDYQKSIYLNSKKLLCITCPKHGDFWQTPNMHLRGHGCQQCSFEKNPIGHFSNTSEFIEKAKKVHGNKYIYDKVDYKHSLNKVEIICPVHGSFMQTPGNHLLGHGCLKCKETSLERTIRLELEERGINYLYNQKHIWIWPLTLDFYLPDYNVGIECQGIEHFVPVEYFGGQECFEKIVQHDMRKAKQCSEHNVPLYYFIGEDFCEYMPEAYTDAKKLLDVIIGK